MTTPSACEINELVMFGLALIYSAVLFTLGRLAYNVDTPEGGKE